MACLFFRSEASWKDCKETDHLKFKETLEKSLLDIQDLVEKEIA